MKRQTSLTEYLSRSSPPPTKQKKREDKEGDDDEIKTTTSLVIGSVKESEVDKDKTFIIEENEEEEVVEKEEKPIPSICSAETIEFNEEEKEEKNEGNVEEEEEEEEEKKFVKLPSKEVLAILREYKSEDRPRTVVNLIRTIKRINISTKNYWGRTGLEFDGLRLFFRAQPEEASAHFFGVLLDKILDAALRLPELYATVGPLPIIPPGARGTVRLSQSYAAAVVANMFFCAFKRDSTTEYLLEPNFQLIYHSPSYAEKLHFFVHYFERVLLLPPASPQKRRRDTLIVYERRGEDVAPDWASSEKPLCAVDFTDDIIEDAGPDFLKADFANRCLGGGVMAHGMVQEEIMFLEAPELLPVRLCFPPLAPKEAAVFMGAERYSTHAGYGHSTTFSGDYVDATEVGDDNIRKSTIIAIDAVHYRSFTAQFAPRTIKRELLKAYAGFNVKEMPDMGVATGNWGCGAFMGYKPLKAIIQLLAASEADRSLVLYSSFGDIDLVDSLKTVLNYAYAKSLTVGSLYGHLLAFIKSKKNELAGYEEDYKFVYDFIAFINEELARQEEEEEEEEDNKEDTITTDQ